MTVTLSNVDEGIFDAVKNFISQWRNVQIERNEEKADDKAETLKQLFAFTKENARSSDGKGWIRDELHRC